MRHNSNPIPQSIVEASPPHSVARRIALPPIARSGLLLLLALLSYYALFRLPFLFPPRQRLMSASYAFGFNNSIAILAMAGLLGVVTLLNLVRRREAIALPIEFPESARGGHDALNKDCVRDPGVVLRPAHLRDVYL